MDVVKGRLKVKIVGKGTRSKGPEYWIEPIDEYKHRWNEILVRKTVQLWQDDPLLHPLVGKMVRIHGEVIETKSTITIDPIEAKEIKKKY